MEERPRKVHMQPWTLLSPRPFPLAEAPPSCLRVTAAAQGGPRALRSTAGIRRQGRAKQANSQQAVRVG